MTIIDGHNFTQLTNLNVIDNLYLEGAVLPDTTNAPLVLNSQHLPDVAPLQLMSGAAEGTYTSLNGGIIFTDFEDEEIWRIWSLTPEDTEDGNDCLFIGLGSGENIMPSAFSGHDNTAVGAHTLASLTLSLNSSAFGSDALMDLEEGNSNSALGAACMEKSDGLNQCAMGFLAMFEDLSSEFNAVLGQGALLGNTTGSDNTVIGSDSMVNASGENNTALGYKAANSHTTADKCIVIGANIDADSPTIDNQLNIGGAIRGSMTSGSEAIIIELQEGDPGIEGVLYKVGTALMVSLG